MDEAGVWSEIESLYRAQFPQFERVARAITGDRESALEAVQEGFADALRRAGQWADRGPLEGWVWRCVVNRARKTRRRPIFELPADESRSDDGQEESELVGRRAALPERQRLVVFLRYFADLEYREIAAALLQATTLSFLVVAGRIGVDLGLVQPVVYAALVTAGLLSVMLFPATALSLLRPAADRPRSRRPNSRTRDAG